MTTIQENNINKVLNFPNFDDIKVSTKTFTTMTNLEIEIDKLFKILPVTPYVVVPTKRGRKKKCEKIDPNKDIKHGSFITIKHEGELRGVELKPKKLKPGKKTKWFRNSITIVIVLDKRINFKVCRNGTFQMTGCKRLEHAELCVKYLWKYMKMHPDIYSFTRGKTLETLFIPSMRNIDFSLGFIVDREKLNTYIHEQKKIFCLLETSFGYTGINIKIPLKKDISTMKVKKMFYDKEVEEWKEVWTTYKEYLDNLSPKERTTKINNVRYNTFLVFHSGMVIMSGLNDEFMRDIYYYFIDIIKDSYDKIEERLLPPGNTDMPVLAELSLEEQLAL